jgi:hypothetical protein
MNREERERLVDGVLDRALGPQAVEPRPGLEERILANLPAHAPRPWWQWMWIPALAAAAVLAVVIGVRVKPPEPAQQAQANKTVEAPRPELATRPEAPLVKKVEPQLSAKRTVPQKLTSAPQIILASAAAPLPRMDTFPSRGTLTPEEKLLVAFVRRQPEQVRAIALERAAHAEEVQKYLETGQVPAIGPTGITK